MKHLRIGTPVIVYIPIKDRAAHAPIVKYHGEEMLIANRKGADKVDHAYYELLGAESDFGIPYAFVREWLIPV